MRVTILRRGWERGCPPACWTSTKGPPFLVPTPSELGGHDTRTRFCEPLSILATPAVIRTGSQLDRVYRPSLVITTRSRRLSFGTACRPGIGSRVTAAQQAVAADGASRRR